MQISSPVLLALALSAVLAACVSAGGAAPPFYSDHTRLLFVLDASGKEHPIETAAAWSQRRDHILANMQEVMGPLPDRSEFDSVPLNVQTLEETRGNGFIRRKIEYSSLRDDRVRAWLFLPTGGAERRAAVLCLHQTTSIGKDEPAGLGGKDSLHYALELARRGYVTLAPDYPYFGEHTEYDPYAHGYVSGTMKAIVDNMRAVDVLQSLPQVDGNRIGSIGHSLGGHNTVFTAAFEERIKAAVSNCGFNAFPKYYGGNLKGWSSNKYMPRIAERYPTAERMPFDFPDVIAAIAPRACLAIAPVHDSNFEISGVRDCIRAAKPVYALLGAPAKLKAYYPECEHSFPPRSRTVAYEWLDLHLK